MCATQRCKLQRKAQGRPLKPREVCCKKGITGTGSRCNRPPVPAPRENGSELTEEGTHPALGEIPQRRVRGGAGVPDWRDVAEMRVSGWQSAVDAGGTGVPD